MQKKLGLLWEKKKFEGMTALKIDLILIKSCWDLLFVNYVPLKIKYFDTLYPLSHLRTSPWQIKFLFKKKFPSKLFSFSKKPFFFPDKEFRSWKFKFLSRRCCFFCYWIVVSTCVSRFFLAPWNNYREEQTLPPPLLFSFASDILDAVTEKEAILVSKHTKNLTMEFYSFFTF